MEWNKNTVRDLLVVVFGGIAFYWALENLGQVSGALNWVLGVISPLLVGGVIAFILNVPMRAIERHLIPRARGKAERLRRPLALILTLVALAGVLALASRVIVPGIQDAAASISQQIPGAIRRLQEQLNSLSTYLPMLQDWAKELSVDWQDLAQKAAALAKDWGGALLSSGGGLLGNVVSGVSTFVIGLIFAFYLLLQKERLSRQSRMVFYAFLPVGWADRLLEILHLANRTFSSFLSGQCLEACILGTLFVITMTLFRFPYALLVGVLIALTALIPIVGAFIGCGVGALLIAVTDPWKALWFVVLFLILQQVEGNLIYPHVVGSSVGLPSIWVLAAVTLGGSLFGITGILLFIPLCSVIYTLFREFTRSRVREKNVPPEKWRDPPPPGK